MTTDAQLTDERAVDLARLGDDRGFTVLYRRYAPALTRMAASVLHDRFAAEDVVQTSFLVASQRLDQLHDPARVGGWLMSICARQAFTALRSRRPDLLFDTGDDDVTADRRQEPEDVALANERLEILLEAAEGLPTNDRVVIRLYLQGFEGASLASALDSEPAKTYVQFHRAKGRLHDSLGALLVSRHARHACDELERLLDEWDGGFTPLLRKRVVRHIDACGECEERRRMLLTPQALLGAIALLGIPATLRPQVAAEFELTSASTSGSPDGAGSGTSGGSAAGSSAGSVAAGAGVVAVAAGAAAGVPRLDAVLASMPDGGRRALRARSRRRHSHSSSAGIAEHMALVSGAALAVLAVAVGGVAAAGGLTAGGGDRAAGRPSAGADRIVLSAPGDLPAVDPAGTVAPSVVASTSPGPSSGPAAPGPVAPGPAAPGPAVPGPAVPGPAAPGPVVPGPVGPGPAAPTPTPTRVPRTPVPSPTAEPVLVVVPPSPAVPRPVTPSVTPSPTPSATPSPQPSVTPSPQPSATPSPDPSPVTPAPEPSVKPSPEPSPLAPSPEPSPAPSPVAPSPEPSPAPSPDPGPVEPIAPPELPPCPAGVTPPTDGTATCAPVAPGDDVFVPVPVTPAPPPSPEPSPAPSTAPSPEPSPVAPSPAPTQAPSTVKDLVGVWKLRPITLGGVTYDNVVMQVFADGTATLLSSNEDSCKWRPGNPMHRGLTGSGRTFSGERYLGPCNVPPNDWAPVSITLDEDLMTLHEKIGNGTERAWDRRS